MKTALEVERKLSEAQSRADEPTKVKGMSYEEGVREALNWVLEEGYPDPMEL